MPVPKITRTHADVAAPAPVPAPAPAADAPSRVAGDSASSAAHSVSRGRGYVPKLDEFVTVGKYNRKPSGRVQGRKPYFDGEYNGTLSDEKEDVADER